MGDRARCFDRPRAAHLGESHVENPNFELHAGDFGRDANEAQALYGCDVRFHLISIT